MSRLFPKDIEEFIKNNVVGMSNPELTKLVNQKFNTAYTVGQINQYKKRQKLSSGLTGHFEKRPVGSLNVKNTVLKAENGKWKSARRAIWEQHYGKIPEGYVVIFLDGDNTNVRIENLEIVSRSVATILYKKGLIYKEPELTKTGILIARIISAKNKHKKKK